MTEKKKAFSKKEKIAGAIASAAIMAVPFMVTPAQQGYATTSSNSPTPTAVEKITTIVIPLNGTKYIDLDALYSAKYMQVGQNQTELNIAEGKFALGNGGIYEITASSIGKATFTVTGTRYEPSYTQITDTFQVIVVPTTASTDEYKFDITEVLNVMKQYAVEDQTSDQVKGLLRNVSPVTVANYDPFEYASTNSAPYQLETTDKIQGFVGETIESWQINQQIYDYFGDSNENMLDVIYIDKNNEHIIIEESYEGEAFLGYELTPLTAGDFDLDVLVVDHHGGFTKGKIPFHIEGVNNPPIIRKNSVLAQHFQSDPLNSVLILSQNAEIDLSEIFFDEDMSSIQYEVIVEAFSSPDNTTHTIELGSLPMFSWESLDNLFEGSITRVKEVRAFDNRYPNEPAVLDVDIIQTEYDPFPASIEMYKSNTAGTSSYILDYQSELGFGGYNYTWIEQSDIHNDVTNAVTASVYQNVYLKFDAKNYTTNSLEKIKVYAHNRETTSILYQDDFNFKVISPEDTRNPATNLPAISPRPLYPYHDDNYWAGSFYFREYVSVLPGEYNNDSSWTFETGSTVTMLLTGNVPTATQVVFKIDPDDGKRIFYVPYIKP